jgi:HlyD family secretion protein
VALEQARNDLRRSEQLAQQGFIAPTKLDTDRLSLQAAAEGHWKPAVAGRSRWPAHDLEQARVALGVVQRAGSAASGQGLRGARPGGGPVLKVLQ